LETKFIFIVLPVYLDIIFYPVSTGVITGILGVILLLCVSAMMSGSEVALFSLNPSQKNLIREENTGRSKQVIHLLSHPERLLATILITNNFVNIAVVILCTFIFNAVIDITEAPWIEFLVR